MALEAVEEYFSENSSRDGGVVRTVSFVLFEAKTAQAWLNEAQHRGMRMVETAAIAPNDNDCSHSPSEGTGKFLWQVAAQAAKAASASSVVGATSAAVSSRP